MFEGCVGELQISTEFETYKLEGGVRTAPQIKAMQDYAAEVRAGEFPGAEHCYNMIEGEEEKFLKLINSLIPGDDL